MRKLRQKAPQKEITRGQVFTKIMPSKALKILKAFDGIIFGSRLRAVAASIEKATAAAAAAAA